MAADQRRKRLNGASIVGYGSREQHRTKRKNLGPAQNDLNMKPHISVEWDGSQKRVVAKREQVGISWRQMRPFANFVPNGHNVLADVFALPQEIFDMDNLSEVLSDEVWKTHLSENERNLLMHFLPRGIEPNQVVQELLAGQNFHFGNPFVKWGDSLCSGYLHPDMILNREQQLKSGKRAYYSELHNFHNDMIGYLMRMKERWESCKDPENEIVQKIWRAYDHGENVSATSESCSWAAEEKACSSDNQISSSRKGDKRQKRVVDKGSVRVKLRNLMISSDDMLNVGARIQKGDKVHKRNIHSSDGDKYMSYIKISKKQHELVKSMKQSGKSIQSRSLNRVLGNLDNIHVQPYEAFIEEEEKKLREHWLQVVNKDIPAAYANWTERQIKIQAVINSLVVEIKDKSKLLLEDEDNVSSGSKIQNQEEDGDLSDQSSSGDDKDSIARSSENQSPRNYYVGGDDEFNPLSTESEKNLILSKSDDASQNKIECSRNMSTQDVSISEGAPFSSGGDVWQAVEMPHSYYDSAINPEYAASGMSLANQRVNGEQRTHLIDLESDLRQEENCKDLLHKQSDDGSFSTYTNQDRSDLLQSLFKGEDVLSYHQEQKGAELEFQTQNNVMMGNDQFPGHFKEPLQTSLTLDQGQRRPSEVYMPENMSQNIYSDGGRYLIPRQDSLSAVNVADWAVNAARMAAPCQSHLGTGEFISQHWFPADGQVRGGWNGSDGGSLSSQSLGAGGNSDQSLFSVLSQCSQFQSSSSYDSVRHTDQFLASRTFGVVDAGTPRINAVVPQVSYPLDYLSGREAPNSMVPDDMTWMNLPHPNSGLHDQLGKPYLRSWNR